MKNNSNKKWWKKLWLYVNKDGRFIFFGIKIFFSFWVFVGAAAWINSWFQEKSAERERVFMIWKAESKEARKIMEDTASLIMKRMFELRRVNWALKSGNFNKADSLYQLYQNNSFSEWNIQHLIFLNKIKMYFGESLAENFSHNNPNSPVALVDYFIQAHRSTSLWKNCLKNYCPLQSSTEICKTNKCNVEEKIAEDSMVILLKFGVEFIEKLDNKYQDTYLKYNIKGRN